MEFDKVKLDIKDGVAVITLNDPDAMNAVSVPMLQSLRKVLDVIEDRENGVRCVVLTGQGRGFCTGANLKNRLPADPDDPDNKVATLDVYYHPMLKRMRDLKCPIIAAVNGPAAGAGMSLAITCDFVYAARSAFFLQAFINIGLVPDAGSTFVLPRLIGKARAARMMMLGERIPAEQALEWGMITEVLDDDVLMDEVMALANRLAKGPTRAYGFIRKALAASWGNTYDQQLDLEYHLQIRASKTEDHQEGTEAFKEKRTAEFQGR
ncbi:MAG: enoyl-CoA hydratase/isomerase [Alphaproteobacteria bacterium]